MLIWLGDVDEGLGRRFLISVWITLLALVAAANIFWNPDGVRGIILGGVVAAVNAIGIRRDTKRIVKWRSQAVYFIGWIARMVLAILIIGTVVLKFPGKFSFPGIFIGVSVVPIAFLVLLFQMQVLRKTDKKEDKQAED